MNKGFTIMEVLIAMFLFVVATIAIVGVSVLATRTAFQAQKQVVAQALANEKIETIHSLLYDRVGLVPSGATVQTNASLPAGSVEYVEIIAQGQQSYTVVTDIIPRDDSANGTLAAGTLSLATADYKDVRIQVTDQAGGVSNTTASKTVVSAATSVANWSQDICTAGDSDGCSVVFPAPAQTFTFSNATQMRTFVNSLGLYTKSPDKTAPETTDGQMYDDSATRTKVCDLKGYTTVGSYTDATQATPANYTNMRWDSATNTFVNSTGNLPTNNYISRLVCTSPKAVAACTYALACPASGKCTDAYLLRGYTPVGAQYISGCKSNADCDTGYSCNIGTGQCSVVGNCI